MSYQKVLLTGFLAMGLIVSIPCNGGVQPPDVPAAIERVRELHASESLRLARVYASRKAVQPKQALDVLHYDLDLRIDPGARSIAGTVAMTFSPTNELRVLKMRLKQPLQVIKASLDSAPVSFKRNGSDLIFTWEPALKSNSSHVVRIQYGGKPSPPNDFTGGILFGSDGTTPSATTLSEPFDSFVWWPCVDDLSDKVTADIKLTAPPGMMGASNGTLVNSSTGPDGWRTNSWRESYPIANYLISANVTNYTAFSARYTSLDGKKKMPVSYYVYPEQAQQAATNFQRVPAMIHYFAGLVGEYPFLKEKYGMISFTWGGGMEHQTLTSIADESAGNPGDYDLLFAHELAHQWFGDDVTCATWNDIWLNEGFATYFEILWGLQGAGMSEGTYMHSFYDDQLYNGYMGGSVYLSNGSNPFGDTGAIYEKGAWVLHMLKYVMGKEAFFRALRNYIAAHAYSNASTTDLQAACEAEYGKSLTWFFDQWVYTPKRPIYSLVFTPSGANVSVTITQSQDHKVAHRLDSANVYIMPVQLTVHYSDGTSKTTTVLNNQRRQTFLLPISKTVLSIGLDEDSRILKIVR